MEPAKVHPSHRGPSLRRINLHPRFPLSYDVPDHFSHLVPLLPHPTPQGISVPIRVKLVPTATGVVDGDGNAEADGSVHTRVVLQTEKGVKVRWPPKRTIGEMRRRVRAMMDGVCCTRSA